MNLYFLHRKHRIITTKVYMRSDGWKKGLTGREHWIRCAFFSVNERKGPIKYYFIVASRMSNIQFESTNKLKRCNSLEIVSFTAQLNAMLSIFPWGCTDNHHIYEKPPSVSSFIHARTSRQPIHNTFRWSVNTISLNLSNTSPVFSFEFWLFYPIPSPERSEKFTIFTTFRFYFSLVSLYRLISYKKKSAQTK